MGRISIGVHLSLGEMIGQMSCVLLTLSCASWMNLARDDPRRQCSSQEGFCHYHKRSRAFRMRLSYGDFTSWDVNVVNMLTWKHRIVVFQAGQGLVKAWAKLASSSVLSSLVPPQQRSQTSKALDDVNLGPSANPQSVASPSLPDSSRDPVISPAGTQMHVYVFTRTRSLHRLQCNCLVLRGDKCWRCFGIWFLAIGEMLHLSK